MEQKLRGFTGQGMNGARKAYIPLSYSYPAGSATFAPTKSGWYRFVLFGAGGGADNGTSSGASGALVIAERVLAVGQSVTVSVGAGGATSGGSGGDTTLTFPWGEVLTAGGGQGATAGVATANTYVGDTAVNGTDGTTSASSSAGADAPASGGYTGGSGATSASVETGGSPGGGGCTNAASGTRGGDGALFIHQTRLRR